MTLGAVPTYKEAALGRDGSGGMQRFGEIEIDEARTRLLVSGRPVEIDRHSLAILGLLLREAGKDVDKDRLLEAGWPNRLVHENSLAKAIGRLRQALGSDGPMLETVHGHGYRLVVDAAKSAAEAGDRRHFRHPAAILAAVALVGAITLGSARLPWGAQQVVNGEPADSVGRVLWVDDHPENNFKERRFLERHRIGVYQVATTDDALTLLRMYAYGAVISDMGRAGRPLAGTDLLKAMRARGDRRPFFLYTVHSSEAQRRLVADSGGQGVAERPDELYAAILPLFGATPPAPRASDR